MAFLGRSAARTYNSRSQLLPLEFIQQRPGKLLRRVLVATGDDAARYDDVPFHDLGIPLLQLPQDRGMTGHWYLLEDSCSGQYGRPHAKRRDILTRLQHVARKLPGALGCRAFVDELRDA